MTVKELFGNSEQLETDFEEECMEELRACPFCGSKAHIEKGMVRFWHNKSRKCRKRYAYMIGCSDPDCILYNSKRYASLFFSASEHGVERIIRKWNRRDGDS